MVDVSFRGRSLSVSVDLTISCSIGDIESSFCVNITCRI